MTMQDPEMKSWKYNGTGPTEAWSHPSLSIINQIMHWQFKTMDSNQVASGIS